ncbi:MAG: thiolase, partial [Gemmobacter sp.]
MADTILVTHGESGRSQIGMTPRGINPAMLDGQFQIPYGVTNPPTMFTIPVMRYLKTYGVDIEKVANVAVVQR